MPEAIVPTKTARKIRTLTGYTGSAALYKLDPPMPLVDWDDNKTGETEFVIVSATAAYSGPETYIFAATGDGEISDWSELTGSFRGGLDHEEALKGAGYEVSA